MKRNITITLEKAKEWYNSDNESLKEVALQAFSEEELNAFDFTKIKTFEDALTALEYNESTKVYIRNTINDISMYSKASAALFKLGIIRKALNLNQDLHLTKKIEGLSICYPYNPLVTKSSTHYKNKINSDKMEIIGRIKNEGIEYYVLGSSVYYNNWDGLSSFRPFYSISYADANVGLFGCGSKEIAQHFSKYFGMLITEAKYADMVDFEIIENKYQ